MFIVLSGVSNNIELPSWLSESYLFSSKIAHSWTLFHYICVMFNKHTLTLNWFFVFEIRYGMRHPQGSFRYDRMMKDNGFITFGVIFQSEHHFSCFDFIFILEMRKNIGYKNELSFATVIIWVLITQALVCINCKYMGDGIQYLLSIKHSW